MHHLPRRTLPSKLVLLALAWTWLATAGFLAAQDSAVSSPEAANPGKVIFEEWVALVLEGKPCGFGSTVTTQIETPTGPQFRSEHQEQFVVKRLGEKLTIIDRSTVTEDADGGVLNFTQATSGTGSDIESTGVREGDDLVVSSRGQTQRYHIPRHDALGPEKIRQLSLAVPLKPGQPFSFDTFDSAYPQAIVVEGGTVVGHEDHEVRGTVRPLWKLSSQTSDDPGTETLTWIDDKGNDVDAVSVLPGLGQLHEYVTDRAECMKLPEGAEVMAANLIRPQIAIPTPADLGQAVYRLTIPDLTKTIALWNEGEQKVLFSGPGTVEIAVTAPQIAPVDITWQLPHADTPELHPYLQSTNYLEVHSPEIQALSLQAVDNNKNPVVAAHLIEKFVRKYITKKDLRIAFASAQETARSREGDCTEHAVLCAALGRAVGLPTRCVVGLGYIPPGLEEPAVVDGKISDTGAFGFHMWAEAWVGPDQWVPMDAALNGFDVGHIAIAKSALAEINPLVDFDGPVMQLTQKLSIHLVGTLPKTRLVSPATVPSSSQEESPPPRRSVSALPPID